MTIIVRRGTVADAELVSLLNADVQAIHAAALPWRFKPPGPGSFPPAEASALLAKPDHLVFIAELASEAVGYAYAEVVRQSETSFRYAYETMFVHHISVRPNHRRQGIGKSLLGAVHAAGQELGLALLALDVWSFNEDARAFFQQQGFASYIERMWRR
jgi:GNAT superfamily N-acetyltransferase